MTEGQPADPAASLPGVPLFGSTVTILFSDIRGFTEYTDKYGDQAAYRMLQLHNNVLKEKLDLYRGHVVKKLGDSYMVSFDSARTAVTCAIEIQRAFDKLHSQHQGATIQVGIGINVGEPVREGADYFGGTVNLAARICGEAGPGQILVSETVRAVIGKMEGTTFLDNGSHELKGFQAPQRLFLVDWSGADHQVEAPAVIAGAPSVEKKGHPVTASTVPPFRVLPRARRAARTPPVLIAVVVAVVLVIAGVVGAIALTRGNSNNGIGNQAANRSNASASTNTSAQTSGTTSTGSGLPKPTGAPTKLSDMPTKSQAFNQRRDSVSFKTHAALDALGFSFNNPQIPYAVGQADYDLGGRFERFQSLVLQDDGSTVPQVRFTVFGDGNRLAEAIVGPQVSKQLDVVVTGVQALSLVVNFQPPTGSGGDGFFIGATLYAASVVATAPAQPPSLRSLDVVGDRPDYFGPVQASGKPFLDAIGRAFTNPQDMSPREIKFTLGGHYKHLKVTEMVPDNSGGPLRITFVADGTELTNDSLSTGDSKELNLDVSGKQTLTVIFNLSSCCGGGALADSALS
jgi:class 3 adenylate cyclase